MFETLPQDGVWLVTWIDRFHLSLGQGFATRVEVCLLRLDAFDFDSVSKIDDDQVQRLFQARANKEADAKATAIEHRRCAVDAAFAAYITVGAVFDGRTLRAFLPRKQICIRLGEPDTEHDFAAYAESPPGAAAPTLRWITSPLGTTEARAAGQRPPTVRFGEWELPIAIDSSFAESAVLAGVSVPGTALPDVVLVPRMVVFQRFIAIHSVFVEAAFKGSWPFASALLTVPERQLAKQKTRIDEASKTWDVILRAALPNSFAFQVAWVNFDSHARRAFSALFAAANKARLNPSFESWSCMCNSELPFRPDFHPRVTLSGYTFDIASVNGTPATAFLVAEINDVQAPPYAWDVRFSRENDNGKGEEGEVTEPGTSRGGKSGKPLPIDIPIREGGEADEALGNWHYFVPTGILVGLPSITKLPKAISVKYVDRKDEKTGESNEATGDQGPSPNSRPRGKIQMVREARVTPARFSTLAKSLNRLAEKGVVSGVGLVQPHLPCCRLVIGPYVLWTLVNQAEVQRKQKVSGLALLCKIGAERIYRSVMVAQCKLGQRWIYLFEIESLGLASTFSLWGISSPSRLQAEVVYNALQVIRVEGGVWRPSGARKLERQIPGCRSRSRRHLPSDTCKQSQKNQAASDAVDTWLVQFLDELG